MFIRTAHAFVVACCMTLLLSACTDRTEPAPSTSSVAHPSSSVSISLSPEEEALRIVNRVVELDKRHLYGGDPTIPKELSRYVTPQVLAWFQEDYETVRVNNYSFKDVENARFEIEPFRGEAPANTIASVHVCSSFQHVEVLRDGISQGNGSIIYLRYFFSMVDGDLRIFDMTGEEVSSCSLK